MKKIKFRAWQKDMEMLVYPKNHYAPKYKGGHIAEIYNTEENEYHTVYEEDDNFILMQFTGLSDKNGVEIYEGDIIASVAELDSIKILGKVVYEIAMGYGLHDKNNDWQGQLGHKDNIEVIGNIYENPELIK